MPILTTTHPSGRVVHHPRPSQIAAFVDGVNGAVEPKDRVTVLLTQEEIAAIAALFEDAEMTDAVAGAENELLCAYHDLTGMML